MSQRASTFVERHLLVRVNRTKGLILMVFASVADDSGTARMMTQPMVATKLGAALPTVKRSVQSMLRDGYLSKAPMRSYVITGVDEHDVMTCVDVECKAEADSIRRGSTSSRKRALAAARARKAREKRKRTAQSQI